MKMRLAAAAFVLFCAACESHSYGSDQYESRERQDPSQLRTTRIAAKAAVAAAATDHRAAPLGVHVPHRFGVFMKKLNKVAPNRKAQQELQQRQSMVVPELQVGCGEGFVDFKQVRNIKIGQESVKKTDIVSNKPSKKRRKRELIGFESDEDKTDSKLNEGTDNEVSLKSRMYGGYSGVPLPNFNFWQQPQAYQISRPYFIPVWGAPGRMPIYFPPQPILLNPGYPARNPPVKSYLPPKGYLPPKTKVDLANRYDEEGPVWDAEPFGIAPPRRPPPPPTTTTPSPPTRRTRRPGSRRTPPPIVRRPDPNEINVQRNNSTIVFSEESDNESDARPAPPLLAAPLPSAQVGLPPSESNAAVGTAARPSRCVWAIISCCSAASGDVSYGCFEQLGCTGAFWDTSPCESEFAKAAIETAMKFYDS